MGSSPPAWPDPPKSPSSPAPRSSSSILKSGAISSISQFSLTMVHTFRPPGGELLALALAICVMGPGVPPGDPTASPSARPSAGLKHLESPSSTRKTELEVSTTLTAKVLSTVHNTTFSSGSLAFITAPPSWRQRSISSEPISSSLIPFVSCSSKESVSDSSLGRTPAASSPSCGAPSAFLFIGRTEPGPAVPSSSPAISLSPSFLPRT
mmetsp:Transcript_10527/g.29748  ORF Transcript_10527/g.29748 Transcript_10527/m.29748 type:complete len:209 (+) Transcript_10527:765-1391(+)